MPVVRGDLAGPAQPVAAEEVACVSGGVAPGWGCVTVPGMAAGKAEAMVGRWFRTA